MLSGKREHVVIVGGGPIGLLTAIKCKQLGIKDVTLIDPRAGTYTRSGDYVSDVFKKFTTFKLNVAASPGKHIKDVERSLFEHAKLLDINICKARFANFLDSTHIAIVDAQQKQITLDCDLIFDCTGTKRVLIKEANRVTVQPIFSIQPTPDDPYKTWLYARVQVPPNEIQRFLLVNSYKAVLPNLNTEEKISMQGLRKLGWSFYSIPTSYANPIDKNKINFYCQAPVDLQEADRKTWIQQLLAMKLGANLPAYTLMTTSRKYPEKNKPAHFTVNPQYVTPCWFGGNQQLPAIVHLGDATFDIPFHFGRGLIYSMKRLQSFLSCLKIEDRAIVASDLSAYEQAVQRNINKTLDTMEQKSLYNVDIVRHAYQDYVDHANEAYRQASTFFAQIKDDTTGLHLYNQTVPLNRLQDCIAELKEAMTILPAGDQQLQTYLDLLQNVCRHTQQYGEHLLKRRLFGVAKTYLLIALDLYQQLQAEAYASNVSKIYLDLMVIANANHEYTQVEYWADAAKNKVFPILNESARERYVAKIIYQQLTATSHALANPKYAKEMIPLMQTATEQIQALNLNPYALGAGIRPFIYQLDYLRSQLPQQAVVEPNSCEKIYAL